jgi:hypothetical protein
MRPAIGRSSTWVSANSARRIDAWVLLRDVVLALVLGETHHLHALIGDKALDVGHECFGLGRHPAVEAKR